jgi:hypothetical protein
LIFGVITAAYFGHFSTGTSARLVLSRDPTGRALLLGNVAAMGVTMVLYCLWVMAVNGALPPSALLGQSGTALRPLAAHIGPVVNVFGGLFVILGMGMASIHYSLALMNQVRDWLPVDPGSGVTPRPRRAGALAWRIATNRHTRFLLGVAPVVLIFGVGEWQLLTGQASFAAPLGVLGVLSLSVLSGTFPALLLAASRQKGEYVPAVVPRVLGHPVVLLGVYLLFAASFFVHGLVIWEYPLQRLAALLVGVAVTGLTIVVVRRGALAARAVVELRVDAGPDQQSQATVNVTVRGRATLAELHLAYRGSNRDVRACVGTSGPLGVPESAEVELPGTSARQLKVWTHRITPTGDSEALPARVEIRCGGESRQFDLRQSTGQVVVPLSGAPYQVNINL